jgi:hypothetical protein
MPADTIDDPQFEDAHPPAFDFDMITDNALWTDYGGLAGRRSEAVLRFGPPPMSRSST